MAAEACLRVVRIFSNDVLTCVLAIRPVHASEVVANKAVVLHETFFVRDDLSEFSVRGKFPHVIPPGVELLSVVPKMFPIEIVLLVEVQLVGMYPSYCNCNFSVRRNPQHLFQVRVVNVSLAVLNDADTRMCQRSNNRQ